MSDRVLMATLAAAGLVAIGGACLLGSTPLGVERVLAALLGGASPGDRIVVWEIRLPRAAAAFCAGAALGASGAALQGLLRNPLAEPGVLGVSATASLAATGVIYYGLVAAGAWAMPVAAIAGALAATALLTAIATRVGSVVALILVGVGLSSFAGAMMALLMNLAPNPFSLADMLNWTLGTVANRSLDDLALAVPFLASGLALLMLARRSLSALTLGEEAAAGVGVDLNRVRRLVVVGAGRLGIDCRRDRVRRHRRAAPGAAAGRSRSGADPRPVGTAGRRHPGGRRCRGAGGADRYGAAAGRGRGVDRRARLRLDRSPPAEGACLSWSSTGCA